MPYNGTDGLYTVFPKAAKPPAELRAAYRPKKEKKPCMYGPRLRNGRCPTKPRTPRARAAGITRGIYSAATGSKRGSSGDKIAGAVGGALGTAGIRLLKQKIQVNAATKAGATLAKIGPRAILRLAGGAVLAAGLVSYYLTKAILNNRAAKKATRQERAFLAARAYRDARLGAIEINGGRRLSGRDNEALSDAFKAQLEELGLSSTNLKGL